MLSSSCCHNPIASFGLYFSKSSVLVKRLPKQSNTLAGMIKSWKGLETSIDDLMHESSHNIG